MTLWDDDRAELIDAYANSRSTFVPGLLPELAVGMSTPVTLAILERRLGPDLAAALAAEYTDPSTDAAELPESLRGPAAGREDGGWLRSANMVGINVRTIQSFWNVVKYALTLPAAHDSIHLLPIWEPGVVMSLYGPSSWEINDEFFSPELAAARPGLDTVERQLRAVVNLLHALGRTVGMDVLPHTDRFSEMALAHPEYFEWLRRRELEIVDHRENLHEQVQEHIFAWLRDAGPAVAGDEPPAAVEGLFGAEVAESDRLRWLVGPPHDRRLRTERRIELVRHLHDGGYEPVPATMAPPFRGIRLDPSEDAVVVDQYGMVWHDYVITEPQGMSRVFNPLARYKLYRRHDDNRQWAIDFDTPRPEVWDYVCGHYAGVQRRFNFDFMRGDMSHVQMRPSGVPAVIDRYYDLLGTVKEHIRTGGISHFGYFAESFLPPRDVFGYGEEMDHLEASRADATLGDLQSLPSGSPEFLRRLRAYHDDLAARTCAPAFTVMTADKDDPRFDSFYLGANEARLFVALFLDMPSYVGLGFEVRDAHHQPASNEHYTKLFVFRERGDSNIYPSKARHGDRYLWGTNGALYAAVTRIRHYADRVLADIADQPIRWLLAPDPNGERPVVAWARGAGAARRLFVVNLHPDRPVGYFGLPPPPGAPADIELEFTTSADATDRCPPFNGFHYRLEGLAAGEARAYRRAG